MLVECLFWSLLLKWSNTLVRAKFSRQDHRVAEAGDCLIQPHCSEQSQLEQVAQGHVLLGFGYPRDGNSTASLGNLCQCLVTGTSHCRKFLTPQCNFLYLNLCSLPLTLSVDTTENSLAPSSSFPHQVFNHVDKTLLELCLIQAEQSQLPHPLLPCQMPRVLYHLCGSSLDLFQYEHVAHVLGSPGLSPDLQICLWWVGGKDHLPWAAAAALPDAHNDFGLLYCKGSWSMGTTGLFSSTYFPAG